MTTITESTIESYAIQLLERLCYLCATQLRDTLFPKLMSGEVRVN